MKVQTETEGDWLTVFSLSGELDAYTAPQFRESLLATIDRDLVWILVDLGEVEYIDSVALGILLGGAKRANERDGDLAVICHRSNVLKVFDISGTRELLNVCEDRGQAQRLLEQRRAMAAARDKEGGQ